MPKKKVAAKKAKAKKPAKSDHQILMGAIVREHPCETYLGVVEGDGFVSCQAGDKVVRAEMVDGKPEVSVS